MDRDDLDDAIAQAAFCGDDSRSRRLMPRSTATDAEIDRFRDQLRRLLDEVPSHVSALELRELLEPDAGDPAEL